MACLELSLKLVVSTELSARAVEVALLEVAAVVLLFPLHQDSIPVGQTVLPLPQKYPVVVVELPVPHSFPVLHPSSENGASFALELPTGVDLLLVVGSDLEDLLEEGGVDGGEGVELDDLLAGEAAAVDGGAHFYINVGM